MDFKNKIFLKQSVLKNMIKSTTFSASFDESKGIITGVLINIKNNILTFVALDGFRLALKSEIVDNSYNINIIVPARTLNELNKILKETDDLIEIYLTSNFIMVNISNDKIILRLLQGDFIKYDSIL
ncbi:DnaN, partial [Candidatus Arthromitus sp. SFB-4]